jgi:hypothetical protein
MTLWRLLLGRRPAADPADHAAQHDDQRDRQAVSPEQYDRPPIYRLGPV